MSAFSERLRALRKKRNMTQMRLGKILSYGYTAIANYESGRCEPSFSDLCRIADYFDVSVDYLLGRTDDIHSNKSMDLYKRLSKISFLDLIGTIEYVQGIEK